MRVVVGLVGAVLIVLMLAEFFVAFLLPRRVKRDPRIARGIYQAVWKPWRAAARRMRPIAADALLGYFGPLALLLELAVWVFGLDRRLRLPPVGGRRRASASTSSAGTFLSASFDHVGTWHRAVGLLEAATAVGVLFTVIGYLPVRLLRLLAPRDRDLAALDPCRRAGERGRAPRQRLGRARGHAARGRALGDRDDGDTPRVSAARVLPLAAHRPELAVGAHRDRRRVCRRARRSRGRRRRDALGRARVQGRPPRARRSRPPARRRRRRAGPRARRGGRGGAARPARVLRAAARPRGRVPREARPPPPRVRAERPQALASQLALRLPPWRPDEQALERRKLAPAYRR